FLSGLLAFNMPGVARIRSQPKDLLEAPPKNKRGGQMAAILSYILMKNHVHLLVRCEEEKNLALLLQKIFIGYTMYFNSKYNRKGVLFQGRSKSKHIDKDEYLNHVFKYVHLNALDETMPEWRKGNVANITLAKNTLLNHPWSSVKAIAGQKYDPVIDIGLVKELGLLGDNFITSSLQWSSQNLEDCQNLIMES
ncbi:transposase, partial [Patescibacteria group bacterium]